MSELYRATKSFDLSAFIYLSIYSSKWLELDLAERKRLLLGTHLTQCWTNIDVFTCQKALYLNLAH